MAVTLSIYYLVPWIRWDRGPYLPNQAVLIDFPSRRFFFFFLEIWPQEFYYITGLLVLAALALFLVTSIAGRMWCGYTCPQTVWTDLMIAVERLFQGDRNARMRLDKARWSSEWLWRKGATHLTWLLIAVTTGGAWVFYFADAPTLSRQFLHFDAPMAAYTFVGILTRRPKINDALGEAVQNASLGALRTTIEHATIIIGGLQRGRARLGG